MRLTTTYLMKHYCVKPSGIMLTQLVDNLATKHTHTHTLHTSQDEAGDNCQLLYDVKGININDCTSKSQGWKAIYLRSCDPYEMSSIYHAVITDNF